MKSNNKKLEEEVEKLRKKLKDLERWFSLQDGQIRVLERERQKFSSIVHQTDAGFLALDSSLKVNWFNSEFIKRFGKGIKPDTLHGEPCHRVLCGKNKICEKCPSENALKKGTMVHHELSLKINGNLRQIYVTAIPIKSPEGKIEEIMVMLQDISELEILQRSQEKLKIANTKLEKANQKLKQLATIDGLTGIGNYRRFEEFYHSEWKRSVRNCTPISVILVDVDFFKLYNDSYGHQAGDKCLIKIAELLNKTANRPGDLTARYGGEEFIVVLSNTDENGVIHISEKLRKGVENLKIVHETSAISDFITISLGGATIMPNKEKNPSLFIKSVDEALYDSKKNGRNRTTIADH